MIYDPTYTPPNNNITVTDSHHMLALRASMSNINTEVMGVQVHCIAKQCHTFEISLYGLIKVST